MDAATLKEHAQMEIEWKAWGTVCVRLREMGVEINDAKALTRALQRWGEEMGHLRTIQHAMGKPVEQWLRETAASPLAEMVDNRWVIREE